MPYVKYFIAPLRALFYICGMDSHMFFRLQRAVALQAAAIALLLLLTNNAYAALLAVPPPPKASFSPEQMAEMASNKTRTGIGTDGIRPLTRPSFLSVADASLSMEHDEPVFVVEYPTGLVRIYPQRILVWHEIVNDVLPDPSGAPVRKDTPLSALDAFCITYSPLTGCVAAFYSVGGRFPTTFGSTGALYNANTLLYDRTTQSVWSQLTGTCIEGPLVGKRLSRIQTLWTSWRGARQRFPNAQVLSRSTGFKRSYGKDPYGSYVTPGNYYDDLRLLHPLSHYDNRFPPKKRIAGIEAQGLFGAVDIEAVRKAQVVNVTLGLTPLALFFDPTLNTVRIFDRRMDGIEKPLTFIVFENKIVDEQTRSEWTCEGIGVYGKFREKKLTPMFYLDAMWFAWSAFYPGTIILPEKSFVREQR